MNIKSYFSIHYKQILTILIGLILLPASVNATIQSLQQDQSVQTIQHWEEILQNTEKNSTVYINTLIQLSAAYQTLGDYPTAHRLSEQALSLANAHGTLTQQVIARSHLGNILLSKQKVDAAQIHLEQALVQARNLDDFRILANVLNNLGNALDVQQNYAQAQTRFAEVIDLAKKLNDKDLETQALINQTRVSLKRNNAQASFTLLKTAIDKVRNRPDDAVKISQLLQLGQLALRLSTDFSEQFSMAHDVFTQALHLAENQDDRRSTSYAKAYLGQIYEKKQRYTEALQLTREAVFFAQSERDLLYHWQWQRGRILQAQQDLNGAKKAYQLALENLESIRTALSQGQRDAREIFFEEIQPVYFSLADVLLQEAAQADSPEHKKALLKEARNTLELLKAAELQNYFQDECVSTAQSKVTELENLGKNTAVLYPILLPNRTELLLSLSDTIEQFTIPVSSRTLEKTVLNFRKNLQVRIRGNFIFESRQLYHWLIAPVLNTLRSQAIDTIVIVPDGLLRTVPLAALHDGKRFLIEEFALATTPSLSLTDPRPLSRQDSSILLNGLSEGVQNFAPLPNVPQEVNNISALFKNNDILLDQTFLLNNFSESLEKKPYSIVHIASHGEFDRNPEKTFLLTYETKLTLNRLENLLGFSELREQPVELLTLSACETAVGDEQAALGLAGVAIKAGARSAIASLWFINDEAASQLIVEFYKELKNPELSKAQALQKAQKKLLNHAWFRHPSYWAPFLLIGNWL